MSKLLENRETKGQFIWILLIRLIGCIMFIAPLYLPILAYFSPSTPNISLTLGEIGFTFVGLFISAGGKQIGILINNIGLVISKILNKIGS